MRHAICLAFVLWTLAAVPGTRAAPPAGSKAGPAPATAPSAVPRPAGRIYPEPLAGASADADLARVGKKMASDLDAADEKDLGHDPGPVTTISSTYSLDAANRSGDEARVTLGQIEVRQGRDDPDASTVTSEIILELRRENDKWICVKAIKFSRTFGVDGLSRLDVTHRMTKAMDVAQGIKVAQAQPLGPADKPLPGPVSDELTNLANQLAKAVQTGAWADAAQFPEFTGATVRVGGIQKTEAGAHILLGIRHDFMANGNAPNPAEPMQAYTSMNVTLRGSPGHWQCAAATTQLDSASDRNGPLLNGTGPKRDVTDEVQNWLDGKPAARRGNGAGPATKPVVAEAKVLPGPAGDELTRLADRLAATMQSDMRRILAQAPEKYGAYTIAVSKVEKTSLGAHVLLTARKEVKKDADVITFQSQIDADIRLSGGEWICAKAASQMQSATSHDPRLRLKPSPPRDVTEDVQVGLDEMNPAPAGPGGAK